MGIVKDKVPDEFLFDGKTGKSVPAEELEESLRRIEQGEAIEG